jgi:hypothetical protein
MKTDRNGCSTTAAGQEQCEHCTIGGKRMVQYDYRAPDGKLFSCVAPSLEIARIRRDRWMKEATNG